MADSEGGRRTRSTRSKATQELPVTPRATRRSRKQNIEEEEEAPQDEIAVEPVVDESPIEVPDDDFDQSFEAVHQTVDDNGSSNFGFDDNLTYEQQSDDKDGNTNQTDEPMEQETFMADLADIENANSFPSGFDENSAQFGGQAQHESYASYQMVEDSTEPVSVDKTEEDTNAQSEDLKTADPDATCLDADEISEDELPTVVKPEVEDAEEVSDEELPGPKLAELPADTEVVSEEELPAIKKEGKRKHESDYDPSDPTEEVEEKKQKTEEKHRLPDLDKYWKAVKADNDDFNAWTYLLQYVDSESDVEAAREAYDAFLSRYCYCYGYWRKYADYEKKKGSMEKCEEVFERGLKAIPLSIDLWIHYLAHVKQKHETDRDFIRSQFERALATCGLEFRSDKLWDGYIKWENEERNLLNIISIYDRLLATPTQGYKTHWENFRELINNNQVHKLLLTDEFKKFRADVRKDSSDKQPEADDQVPPGEDEPNDHVRNEEEADAIRKLIINKRKKINKATVEMINKRWSFEEGIKRPYFHVKQLERIQLKNWKEYLDYEIELGDRKRILVLFERCLIACALYEEFWLKLIRYLETNREDPEFEWRTRDCFERACNIHHPDKPSLLMMWSAFEETHGNYDKASEILQRLDQMHPNLLQVAYFRINLERRQGNFDKCVELYQQYVASAKNKNSAASLSIKHARFLNKIRKDFDGAMGVLKAALAKDPLNTRIALQIIDLALQRESVDEKEILAILDAFMTQDSLDPDQKLLFAQRKVEFLEDFGDSVKDLQEAQKALQVILEKAKEHKKKTAAEHESSSSSKKSKESSASNGNPYSSAAYNYNSSHYGSSAYPSYASSGQYDYNQQSYYQQGAYANQWGSSY